MNTNLKAAVILSILSMPSRLYRMDYRDLTPVEIFRILDNQGLTSQEIIADKYSGDPAIASELIIESCLKKNISILTLWDDEYPPLLKEIYNPPFVIYSTGKIPRTGMVSIVGTRDSDNLSESVTLKISSAISMAGFTIVSGMASGIDRYAHIGALSAGGHTIAVLPGGVDKIYPYKNSDLYKMIRESGSIISEYPPGTGIGQKWTFARRNRIISGMSRAVIVTQAPLKSGAMITARYALEQNRELFACPGNAFDDKYSGCNELIRQGAVLLSDINNFFIEIDPGYTTDHLSSINDRGKKMTDSIIKNNINKSMTDIPENITGKIEISILNELKTGEIDIDKYIRLNGLSAEDVNRAVTILEIEGLIARKGNRINLTKIS